MYELLSAVVLLLELETREMQRMEFVVQDGKYYILAVYTLERTFCYVVRVDIYFYS